MYLTEVGDKKTRKEFLLVPKRLYTKDEPWVCPLDREVEAIFDPAKNSSFEGGEAIRWILKSEDGQLLGRIAAFYNTKKAMANSQPTGGIGFFECIEDRDAAYLLFDTAVGWLKDKGMEAVDAPINFGENESHWGLLVEGFVQQGYGMPYNKKYYKDYFESYGFKNYFEQYSYHKDVASVHEFPERFMRIAARVAQRPGYTFEHARFSEVDKYVGDLVEVYNSAWAAFKKDFTPMDPERIKETFLEAKNILDEELIWFAYHNDKPIAFYIIFPDLNQILKHLNGKLDFVSVVKFLYYKQRKTMTRMRALIAGVSPEYQNIGIESAIFKKLYEVFKKKPYYKELELSWVGDFNPKMISIYNAIGAKLAKKHITYRYIFDPKIEFVRYIEEHGISKVELIK
ncbi:MAG: hypothetical protein QNK30_00490 [Bacteroidales bacterium]|nr:hypothetical protein [Bacteroidales bacterium]